MSLRRRNPSLSSTSSSSLGSMSDSAAPVTPLRYFGIPFSWEQFPGIPKKNSNNKDQTLGLLPLPPSRKSLSTVPMLKRYSSSHSDPFFAALVECSKDDHQLVKEPKHRPSVYMSCKRTCEVAESIVYLPRSRAGYFYR